jgi:hypothetical protein
VKKKNIYFQNLLGAWIVAIGGVEPGLSEDDMLVEDTMVGW